MSWNHKATYTLTLSSCSLLPTPKLYLRQHNPGRLDSDDLCTAVGEVENRDTLFSTTARGCKSNPMCNKPDLISVWYFVVACLLCFYVFSVVLACFLLKAFPSALFMCWSYTQRTKQHKTMGNFPTPSTSSSKCQMLVQTRDSLMLMQRPCLGQALQLPCGTSSSLALPRRQGPPWLLGRPTLGNPPWSYPSTLFGFGRVFHKPALGSSSALRNISKEKRFLFWDDFRPVEYGQRTVPVTTFLSLFQHEPFEVQVSQSFNDGNALNGTTAACSLPKAKACGQQREVLTMKTSVIWRAACSSSIAWPPCSPWRTPCHVPSACALDCGWGSRLWCSPGLASAPVAVCWRWTPTSSRQTRRHGRHDGPCKAATAKGWGISSWDSGSRSSWHKWADREQLEELGSFSKLAAFRAASAFVLLVARLSNHSMCQCLNPIKCAFHLNDLLAAHRCLVHDAPRSWHRRNTTLPHSEPEHKITCSARAPKR